MSQRLVALMDAIRREQDPEVRARAAALLLHDLTCLRAAAQETLDDAVGELRRQGVATRRIDALLELPAGAALHTARP